MRSCTAVVGDRRARRTRICRTSRWRADLVADTVPVADQRPAGTRGAVPNCLRHGVALRRRIVLRTRNLASDGAGHRSPHEAYKGCSGVAK